MTKTQSIMIDDTSLILNTTSPTWVLVYIEHRFNTQKFSLNLLIVSEVGRLNELESSNNYVHVCLHYNTYELNTLNSYHKWLRLKIKCEVLELSIK